MKPIKNTEDHVLEIPFEGYTYTFPQDEVVSVPDELAVFLEERLPLAFNFGKQLEKVKGAKKVEKVKTKSFFPTEQEASGLGTEDMKIQNVHPAATFGAPDSLPKSGSTDGDGVSWYGEGVEVEQGGAL